LVAYADASPVGVHSAHSNGCEREVATRRGENAWLAERDVIALKERWFTFLAKLAIYARERAYMKDMPVALLVVLSKRDTTLMHRVFDRVVDNGRVMGTMSQMIRSPMLVLR
jgi:hypothetical protein